MTLANQLANIKVEPTIESDDLSAFINQVAIFKSDCLEKGCFLQSDLWLEIKRGNPDVEGVECSTSERSIDAATACYWPPNVEKNSMQPLGSHWFFLASSVTELRATNWTGWKMCNMDVRDKKMQEPCVDT